MNIRDIEYLIAVVEEKSMGKAAEKLYTTQPNISRVVRKLETSFNVSLFNKTKQPWSLTYAGELFYTIGSKMVALNKMLFEQMNDISQSVSGRITLGAVFFEEKFILSKILPVFRTQFPNIEVKVLEDESKQLEKLILRNVVDYSLVILPVVYSELEYIPVCTYDFLVVLPLRHRIVKEKMYTEKKMTTQL